MPMFPRATQVLVIIPSADLRNSVRFALEAEGFRVTLQEGLSGRTPPSAHDCVVLDHHAIDGAHEEARRLSTGSQPVVLLANSTDHPLGALMYRIVLKPMLGAALASAVKEATGARMSAT